VKNGGRGALNKSGSSLKGRRRRSQAKKTEEKKKKKNFLNRRRDNCLQRKKEDTRGTVLGEGQATEKAQWVPTGKSFQGPVEKKDP